jgi:hypothetical protein
VSQAGKIGFEEARKLLEQCGWVQANAMKKIWEKEQRETLVLKLMERFETLELEQAQNALQQYGWNLEAASKALA